MNVCANSLPGNSLCGCKRQMTPHQPQHQATGRVIVWFDLQPILAPTHIHFFYSSCLPPLQLTSCLCTDYSGLLGQPALDICALVCSAVAMAKRVAVILSGCGVYDGTEIHEASAVLVHLSREGAKVREGHWCLCDDS